MNNQMRTDSQSDTQPDILLGIPEHIWQQCEAYKECPEGWWETARKVEAVLLAESVQVRQMKEKFGELLYEVSTADAYEVAESMLFFNGKKYFWLQANGCSCWDGDYYG